MLDVVDGGGHGALEGGHDALFHLFGRQAVVAPDNADHGDIDIGEYIDRHGDDGGHAENGNQERDHYEGIGPS